ncbi:MAG: DUF4097 family beta strand repeat protein [Eubacterium sp.]|nr:DUF4097 family beta strand repeat protein [Eubacterium sp.]
MSGNRKFLYIGLLLIGVGIIVGFAGFALMGFRFKGQKIDIREYTDESNIEKIVVNTDISDVSVGITDAEKIIITYGESKSIKINISVENGTLTIKEKGSANWFDMLSFIHFGNNEFKVKILIPEKALGEISISSDTGDISLEDINVKGNIKLDTDTGDIFIKTKEADSVSYEDINIKTDTGDVTLTDVKTANLNVKVDTGDIELTNTLVDDILKINTSTGDVKVEKSDAGEIEIKTSTGDIEASFLTEKVFVTSSSTGDIRVPESYQGGKCKLTTSTGDITVKYVK